MDVCRLVRVLDHNNISDCPNFKRGESSARQGAASRRQGFGKIRPGGGVRDATLIPGSPYPPRISLGFPPMSTNHTNLVVLRTHSQVEQGGTTKPRSHPRLTATVPHRFDPAHRHGTGNKTKKQSTSTRRNGPEAAGGAANQVPPAPLSLRRSKMTL